MTNNLFIAPTNGQWGSWSSYSSCEGNSYISRNRNCDRPSPAHGGRYCSGHNREIRDCNECAYNNGGCGQNCINYYRSYACSCFPNYKLAPDKKKCISKFKKCNIWCVQWCVMCNVYIHTFRYSNRLIDRLIDRQTGRQADRQTDRKTDRQTERQTER